MLPIFPSCFFPSRDVDFASGFAVSQEKNYLFFSFSLHFSFPSFSNSCCIKVLVLEPSGKSRICNWYTHQWVKPFFWYYSFACRCHRIFVKNHETKNEKKNRQPCLIALVCSAMFFFRVFCVTNAAFRQGKTDLSTMWHLTHVIAPCKGIQGSLGSCIIPQSELGFQIFHDLCWWNVDSEFQKSVGFRIPWAVFQIPKARISDSRSKNFLDFGIRNSFTWGKH